MMAGGLTPNIDSTTAAVTQLSCRCTHYKREASGDATTMRLGAAVVHHLLACLLGDLDPNDENVENHPGHIANKVQFNFVEKLKTHGHLHIDKISFFFLTKISNSLYILWSNFVIEERADQK